LPVLDWIVSGSNGEKRLEEKVVEGLFGNALDPLGNFCGQIIGAVGYGRGLQRHEFSEVTLHPNFAGHKSLHGGGGVLINEQGLNGGVVGGDGDIGFFDVGQVELDASTRGVNVGFDGAFAKGDFTYDEVHAHRWCVRNSVCVFVANGACCANPFVGKEFVLRHGVFLLLCVGLIVASVLLLLRELALLLLFWSLLG
jgi:hypothetical protein